MAARHITLQLVSNLSERIVSSIKVDVQSTAIQRMMKAEEEASKFSGVPLTCIEKRGAQVIGRYLIN